MTALSSILLTAITIAGFVFIFFNVKPIRKISPKTAILLFLFISLLVALYFAWDTRGDDNLTSEEPVEPPQSDTVETTGPEPSADDLPNPSNPSDLEEIPNPDVETNGSEQKVEIPSATSLTGATWLRADNVYKDSFATTMRGESWTDCIRFGSSNINSDGEAIMIAVCDQKYNKFTAEISPQEGFDTSEPVTLCISGVCDEEEVFREEFSINYLTKPFCVELDISGVDDLYLKKSGNYNQARIALQYLNNYRGMGVIMRDAMLSP